MKLAALANSEVRRHKEIVVLQHTPQLTPPSRAGLWTEMISSI